MTDSFNLNERVYKRFDLALYGRSVILSYRKLLEFFITQNLNFVTHREHWEDPKENNICLRHDVDHCIYRALMMAIIEESLGIKSVYYFLPPGDYGKKINYYGEVIGSEIIHLDSFIEQVSIIHGLGHEIGLHNDFLQLSELTGKCPKDLIENEIGFFKSNNISIFGTASHGSRFARHKGMVNYEIFSEVEVAQGAFGRLIDTKNGVFPLHSIRMSDLNLSYEAYMLKREIYISDVGSGFSISVKGKGKQSYIDGTIVDLKWLEGVITEINGPTILLVHPEWWKSIVGN